MPAFNLDKVREARSRGIIAKYIRHAAKAARIGGKTIDLEEWVKVKAFDEKDIRLRALLLSVAAEELAALDRVPGAVKLMRQAILAAREAGIDTMLEVVSHIAPVLRSAGMREELGDIVDVLEELRIWFTRPIDSVSVQASDSLNTKG